MASTSWARVREILEEALELELEERTRLVETRCAGDEALRREVLALLEGEERARQSLRSPIEGLLPELVAGATSAFPPGTRIGQYVIERVIASGGMGTVYEAWQEAPRRRVALKLLGSALASSAEVSRFRFEIEVLARLQHPGIAQVYESGMHVEPGSNGRRLPYFALEFVEGGFDLLSYCKAHALDLRARLEIFAQVCAAVHHGHQKGVVHRDLKPGNLLVSPDGRVKVIDFGVARAVEKEMDLRTRHTERGQLVGTLFYMSPEQFGADPNAVDTRSDVWALGVVLFELLTGALPFDLDERPMHAVARIVCDEPPLRPRSVVPALPAEVEWIVLKALEKEPHRRYASAAELLADVQRFLADEPVLAGAPSRIHRLRLFVRRNRVASAVAALAVVALVASGTWYLLSLSRARATERRRLYSATLASASAALGESDLVGARRALDAAPPEERAWEWRHLNARLDECVDLVLPCEFSLASRPVRGTTTWWAYGTLFEMETTAGAKPRRLMDLSGEVAHHAWSPDGRYLLVSDWSCRLQIYDLLAEPVLVAVRELTELRRDLTHSLEFSPCGDRILVALEQRHALVFDGRLRSVEHDLRGFRGVIGQAKFALDEEHVALFDGDGGLWLVTLGEPGGRLLSAPGERLWSLDVAPDRRRVAYCTETGVVRVLDLAAGGVPTYEARIPHPAVASGLAFDPTGRWLAAADTSAVLHILDTSGRADPLVLRGHTRPTGEAVWSADSTRVYTRGGDRTIRIWEPGRGSCARRVGAHVGDVQRVGFSPDSRRVVTTAGRYGGVSLFDSGSAALIVDRLTTPQAAKRLVFDPRGGRLAVASRNVCVLADSTLAETWRVPMEDARTETPSIAWDPRDGALVVADELGRIRRWRVGDSAPLAEHLEPGLRTKLLTLHPGRDRLVLATDREILHYAASTLALIARREVPRRTEEGAWISGLAIAPDGRRVYASSLDATLREYSLPDLDLIRTTVVEDLLASDVTEGINDLALSPDGTRLALASRSSLVRLFDAHTLEPLLNLTTAGGWVGCVAFSPDGCALAAGGSDGSLFLWTDRARLESGTFEHPVSETGGPRDRAWTIAMRRLCDASTSGDELTQAIEIASALQWTDQNDARAELCIEAALVRRGRIGEVRRRCEDLQHSTRESDPVVCANSRALEALAVAMSGDVVTAETVLREAEAAPGLDEHGRALADEARSWIARARKGER